MHGFQGVNSFLVFLIMQEFLDLDDSFHLGVEVIDHFVDSSGFLKLHVFEGGNDSAHFFSVSEGHFKLAEILG